MPRSGRGGKSSTVTAPRHVPVTIASPGVVQLIAKVERDSRGYQSAKDEDSAGSLGYVAVEVDRELISPATDERAVRPYADECGGVDEKVVRGVLRIAHCGERTVRGPAGGHETVSEPSRLTRAMRILLVSQMYPGPDDPDLGVFVANLERELLARGHEIERAVVDRREGGKRRHARLFGETVTRARQFRPDVVYAHFLAPAGLAAALGSRAPLVVTAHGQDVRSAGSSAAVRAATRYVVRRAATVVAVSHYLRGQLETAVPEARGKTEVVDCGVDLERFAPRDAASTRAEVGWSADGTAFLCLGALSERKNVLRLARAFERRGEGALAFVGDGPLRGALEGRAGVRLVGRVSHDEVPRWIGAADVVCQPSLVEPFGLATLEAMAAARSVVATRVGGPPEFVSPESGVLVDPQDEDELVAALDAAAALPRPNLAAREAAATHDVRAQAARVEEILSRAAGDRRA